MWKTCRHVLGTSLASALPKEDWDILFQCALLLERHVRLCGDSVIIFLCLTPHPLPGQGCLLQTIFNLQLSSSYLKVIVWWSSSWPECCAKDLGEICSYKISGSVKQNHLFFYGVNIRTSQVFSLPSCLRFLPKLKKKKKAWTVYVLICVQVDHVRQKNFICLTSSHDFYSQVLKKIVVSEHLGGWPVRSSTLFLKSWV